MSHEHPPSSPSPKPDSRPPVASPPEGSHPVEDAGTQALSEALRSSFNIVRLLMVVLVVALVFSGLYTVEPNQMAIKLRFGKPVGIGEEQLLQPGLHWKLPYPIHEIVSVPVGESHTVTSRAGWYAMTPDEELAGEKSADSAYPFLQPGVDGYTLSGDGNIVHVRAQLSYRITDPVRYAFAFVNVTNLLQDTLDNALFYVAARFSADQALYLKVADFKDAVVAQFSRAIEQHRLGVSVVSGDVRVEPPLYVQRAFDEVLESQQKGNIAVQDAEAYARGVTNRALGDASAVVQGGINRSNLMVQTIRVEATNFLGLRPSYEKDPVLFRQRFLAERVGRVLTNAQSKTFLPERADGRARELRLLLSQEVEPPKKVKANP